MNEQEFYRDVVQSRIVNDDTVRCFAQTERKPARPVFRRVLIPVLTALAITCGLIMAIPSARAEVLGWFQPSSAAEYLGAEPENREPVPELDAMIVTPKPSQTQIKVNYVADEPYWREIGEDFSATLGETIFDGNSIYLKIDFDGLSGYPLFENAWCPSLPADALLPTYLSEEIGAGQWSEPDNCLYLTAENGVQLPACIDPISRPVEEAFRQTFHSRYGFFKSFDEKTASAWREDSWEHCKTNGVRAVATIFPEAAYPRADLPIDANGYLTLRVNYTVQINRNGDSIEKLNVDLGTVMVNMTAYQDLKSDIRSIEASTDPIALSGDVVFGERWTAYQSDHDQRYTANLDGVTLCVTDPGTVDLLGVHGLKILLTMPDDWSEEQMEAFARNLLFDIVIDGTDKISYGGGMTSINDGSCTLDIDVSGSIPFQRIRTMQKITLTPVLHESSERTHPEWTLTLTVN